MRHWIFQANPKHYDIVAALSTLDRIDWRVPQYTSDVAVGDLVLIWRSGADAGIVGIGTVSSQAREARVADQEMRFVVDADAENHSATRVVVAVRPTKLVEKAAIAALPAMSEHQIVTAPMGTVFPLTSSQWTALEPLLSPAPDAIEVAPGQSLETIVPTFAWADRRKDTYPLPGGYDAQLLSLEVMLDYASTHQPSFDEFAEWVQAEFGSSGSNARHIALFLKRTGFLREAGGRVALAEAGETFLATKDGFGVVAQLHSRIRFVGEFLGAIATPKSPDEMLQIANEQFWMGWNTKAQIQRRRGWLQSCGAVEVGDDDRLSLTVVGSRLVAELTLEPPMLPASEVEMPGTVESVPNPEIAATTTEVPVASDVALELQERLIRTSTLSSSPDDFEFAIRDAFRFLGFRAEKLGGAGKTDVVADADLGRGAAYRIIIDGKTTARDLVSDSQIDWDTIDDHRKLHEADFVVIAGPGFAGSRTRDRATGHDVILMTANDLSELVRQHDVWPLSLDSYRKMFDGQVGEADLEALTEEVEATDRLLEVAAALATEIENHASETGALTARDLYLLLRNQPDLEATEEELQTVAEALASPFVGLLARVDNGFRLSGSRATTGRRLELMSRFFNR